MTFFVEAGVHAADAQPLNAKESARPSLFMSCPLECFDSYLRQELSYFDIAQDPYRADFTIVVTRQQAGHGGERFTTRIARVTPRGPDTVGPSLQFSVPAGTPDVITRRKLLQSILQLLWAEFGETEHRVAFEFRLARRNGKTLSGLVDRWKYWVLAPEIRSDGEGGSGYYFVDLSAGLTVRRITDLQKFRLRASYSRRWSGYLLEDRSRARGDVDRWEVRGLYARSIGERWALGSIAVGRANEFENLKGHARGALLGEMNLFPYTENASRQLRVAYQAGLWFNAYVERSHAGLLREFRAFHALSVIADLNQGWGGIQWVGQVNHFLDRGGQYRLSTGVVLAVRLFAGMSLSLEGEAARVQDQINLRGRRVTDRELLLWTIEQPTGYLFESSLVLTYTFGSNHNTIVNPRFARVDLDED